MNERYRHREVESNNEDRLRAAYISLGLEKDASLVEIKRAYRELAKVHHPDHGGNPNRFKHIVSSYNVLIEHLQKKNVSESSNPYKVEREAAAKIRNEAISALPLFSVGDRVSVPRTSGLIEDDWIIDKIDWNTGDYIVVKYEIDVMTVKKRGVMQKHKIWKEIPFSELDNIQERENNELLSKWRIYMGEEVVVPRSDGTLDTSGWMVVKHVDGDDLGPALYLVYNEEIHAEKYIEKDFLERAQKIIH